MKAKTKQWILLIVCFAAYIAVMNFWRFKFGIFMISAAYLVISFILLYFLRRWERKGQNSRANLQETGRSKVLAKEP